MSFQPVSIAAVIGSEVVALLRIAPDGDSAPSARCLPTDHGKCKVDPAVDPFHIFAPQEHHLREFLTIFKMPHAQLARPIIPPAVHIVLAVDRAPEKPSDGEVDEGIGLLYLGGFEQLPEGTTAPEV